MTTKTQENIEGLKTIYFDKGREAGFQEALEIVNQAFYNITKKTRKERQEKSRKEKQF